MSLVELTAVLLSSVIALFIIVGIYLRKFHSTPSPPTLVEGGDHVSKPPHEVKKPPPNDGSHNASSSTLPPGEVNKPLPVPDDGSRDAPSSTLQPPTLPMKIHRPNDSSHSTVYPECQEGLSPRAPDISYQPSFSAYKLSNVPATERGEYHGLPIV